MRTRTGGTPVYSPSGLTLALARHLVVFLRRPGTQRQFSTHLRVQLAERDCLRDAQDWIATHPAADLSGRSDPSPVGPSLERSVGQQSQHVSHTGLAGAVAGHCERGGPPAPVDYLSVTTPAIHCLSAVPVAE